MKTPGAALLTAATLVATVLSSIAPLLAGPPFVASAAIQPDGPAVDIRINAGGSSYTDTQGQTWQADKAYAPGSWGYMGGSSFSNIIPIEETVDDPLYQSQRSLPVEYRFDVPNDVYEVELRFAEIYCTIDCRSFNVKTEGSQVLTGFGPFKYVGYRKALTMTYLVPVTDNQLNVEFVNVTGTSIINALRVTGTIGGPARNELRINAGGFDYLDTEGHVWLADQRFMPGGRGYGGTLDSYTMKVATAIANTSEQALLQTNRYGIAGSTFGYTFTVPNGVYNVDLLFAELYVSVNAAGQRVFDVWANGNRMLTNLDVFAQSGNRYRAISETLPITVLDSQIIITFTQKTANAPIVNAIAITPMDLVAPGSWANFQPGGWSTSLTPAASIQVQDDGAGLDVSSGRYAYSTNGGASFSDWLPASTSGAQGARTPQLIMAAAVPFNQESATQNQVKFRISDIAGNASESPVFTVPVDVAPPASVITSPPSGLITSGLTVHIQGTAADALSGVQSVDISTDGGSTWSATGGADSWAYTFNAPADGSYAIRSRARDVAGLLETPSPGINLTLDTTAPVSVIQAPPGGVISDSTYLLTGTASDAIGVQSVEVSTDGGATWNLASGTTAWSYLWTGASEGSYTVRSRAHDVSGWTESPGPGVTILVDMLPPATLIRTPYSGQLISSAGVVITGTAFDATSGVQRVELSFDNGTTWASASGTTTWSYAWSPPGQGQYFIRARSVDRAGWVDNPGTTVRVVVDRVLPSSTINNPHSGQIISSTTYMISGVAADDAAGSGLQAVEFSGNGLTWETASGLGAWTYNWTQLPNDGIYTIRSRARDLAGNVQSPPYQVAVTIDRRAPIIVVTSPSAGQAVPGGSLLIQGSAGDGAGSGVALVELSIDGAAWIALAGTTSWNYDWTPPTPGGHNLRLRATDFAGNTGDPGAGINIIMDDAPPQSAITSPESAALLPGHSALIRGTSSDPYSSVASVDVSTDGGATWSAATLLSGGDWTYNWTFTGDGLFGLRSRAMDRAGNVESPGPGILVQVDSISPSSSIDSPFDGQYLPPAFYMIAGQADDVGTGVKRVEVSIDDGPWQVASGSTAWSFGWTAAVGDGPHTIRSRSIDTAGNVEAPGPGVTVIVDGSSPTSTIAQPLDGQIVSATELLISGASDDALSGVDHVRLGIRRNVDGLYWDGSEWIFGEVWLPVNGVASAWSYLWTDLPVVGSCTIRVQATDTLGNTETPGAAATVVSRRGYDVFLPLVITGMQ